MLSVSNQPGAVVHTLACSKDFPVHVVCVLCHTQVFLKHKSSCTVKCTADGLSKIFQPNILKILLFLLALPKKLMLPTPIL